MATGETSGLEFLRNIALILSPIVAAVVAWGVARYNITNDRKVRQDTDLRSKVAKIRGFIAELEDFKTVLEDKQSDVTHARQQKTDITNITFSDLAMFTSIRLPELADYIDNDELIRDVKDCRQDVRDLQNSLERYASPKCSDNDITAFDTHFDDVIGKIDILHQKACDLRDCKQKRLAQIS